MHYMAKQLILGFYCWSRTPWYHSVYLFQRFSLVEVLLIVTSVSFYLLFFLDFLSVSVNQQFLGDRTLIYATPESYGPLWVVSVINCSTISCLYIYAPLESSSLLWVWITQIVVIDLILFCPCRRQGAHLADSHCKHYGLYSLQAYLGVWSGFVHHLSHLQTGDRTQTPARWLIQNHWSIFSSSSGQ